MLAKYCHVFLVGLQSGLIYRWNFAIRAAFSLFPLAFVYILWSAAYQGRTEIGGFPLYQTITYFLALLVLQFFIGAFNEDYLISEEIQNGLINQFLLKPLNYYGYRFTLFVSARLISGTLALIPLVLAYPLLTAYLAVPDDLGWRLAYGLPAAAMAAIIQFTIAYIFGLLTFWFLEIQSFVILSLALESILGGQIFPLDLLPETFFRVSQFLPYYYQMYFPAAIFTGRLYQAAATEGLFIQAFWVLALLALGQLLWRRGLRRHTAVGG